MSVLGGDTDLRDIHLWATNRCPYMGGDTGVIIVHLWAETGVVDVHLRAEK